MSLFKEPLQEAQKELALLQTDNTSIQYTTMTGAEHSIFTYTPCKIASDLKGNILERGIDIGYNGWGDYGWFEVFRSVTPISYNWFETGLESGYKPLLCIYTPDGKYGYSKLDIYYAKEDWEIHLVYEYKWKNFVRKEYYSVH